MNALKGQGNQDKSISQVKYTLPSVTLEINMPSSFPLKGVEPMPPAIDKPRPPVVLLI